MPGCPVADRLVIPAEAARRLGVHPKSIARWTASGWLAAVDVDGRRMIPESSLRAAMDRLAERPAPAPRPLRSVATDPTPDVLRQAGYGWTVRQIALLLSLDATVVARILARHGRGRAAPAATVEAVPA